MGPRSEKKSFNSVLNFRRVTCCTCLSQCTSPNLFKIAQLHRPNKHVIQSKNSIYVVLWNFKICNWTYFYLSDHTKVSTARLMVSSYWSFLSSDQQEQVEQDIVLLMEQKIGGEKDWAGSKIFSTARAAQLFWARIKDIKAILRYKNFQSADPAQFWRYNQNKNCSETSIP